MREYCCHFFSSLILFYLLYCVVQFCVLICCVMCILYFYHHFLHPFDMMYRTSHAHASLNIIEKNDFDSSVIQLVEQPSSRDRKVQSWYRRPNRTSAPENQVKGESIIHRFYGLEMSPSFSGRNTVLSSA